MTIEELFPDVVIEDSNTEFKGLLVKGKDDSGASKELDWLKTIAAFANGNGGRLFIGVENGTHKIIALDADTADKQILLLNQEIKNRLDPIIHPCIKKHIMPWSGHNILLEVVVAHSPQLPVFVKDRGTYFTFIRRFGQTDIASSLETRQLLMASEDVSYDSYFTDEKFDKDNFSSFFEMYKENRGEELKINTLILKGFIDKNGNLSRGALLFKDNTTNPLTLVSVVKYPAFDKGSNELDFVAKYTGPIHQMIKKVAETVTSLTGQGLIKTSEGEKRFFTYPKRSVLEAIANAYAHRNYWINGAQIQVSMFLDRLEITSPGSLVDVPFLKSEKNLNRINPRHRNPIIADTLMILGLVQGLGTCFSKIEEDYAYCDELHKPFAESDSTSFTLTLPNMTYRKGVLEHDDIIPDVIVRGRTLNENEEKILQYCYYKKHTIKEIAEYLGVSISTYLSTKIIGKLVEEGLLLLISNNPKTYMTNRDSVDVV